MYFPSHVWGYVQRWLFLVLVQFPIILHPKILAYKNIILIQGRVSYDLHKHVHKSTQNVQPVMFWDLPSCSSDRIFVLMSCGCFFPKLFAICQVALTVKTNPILLREKNPREWLPLFSPPSPKDKSWWQTFFSEGYEQTSHSWQSWLGSVASTAPLRDFWAQGTMSVGMCVRVWEGGALLALSCLGSINACFTYPSKSSDVE